MFLCFYFVYFFICFFLCYYNKLKNIFIKSKKFFNYLEIYINTILSFIMIDINVNFLRLLSALNIVLFIYAFKCYYIFKFINCEIK